MVVKSGERLIAETNIFQLFRKARDFDRTKIKRKYPARVDIRGIVDSGSENIPSSPPTPKVSDLLYDASSMMEPQSSPPSSPADSSSENASSIPCTPDLLLWDMNQMMELGTSPGSSPAEIYNCQNENTRDTIFVENTQYQLVCDNTGASDTCYSPLSDEPAFLFDGLNLPILV